MMAKGWSRTAVQDLRRSEQLAAGVRRRGSVGSMAGYNASKGAYIQPNGAGYDAAMYKQSAIHAVSTTVRRAPVGRSATGSTFDYRRMSGLSRDQRLSNSL